MLCILYSVLIRSKSLKKSSQTRYDPKRAHEVRHKWEERAFLWLALLEISLRGVFTRHGARGECLRSIKHLEEEAEKSEENRVAEYSSSFTLPAFFPSQLCLHQPVIGGRLRYPSPRLHIHRTTNPTTSTHPGIVELFSDFFYHVVFCRIFQLFWHLWTGVKRLTLHPRLLQVFGTLRGQLLSPPWRLVFKTGPPNLKTLQKCFLAWMWLHLFKDFPEGSAGAVLTELHHSQCNTLHPF